MSIHDLFGGLPPHVGTDTSRDAAVGIASHAEALREAVYGFIKAQGGAICEEVEVGLDMIHQTASARIRELVLKGRLIDSGKRRRTSKNRQAAIWVLPGEVVSPPVQKTTPMAEVKAIARDYGWDGKGPVATFLKTLLEQYVPKDSDTEAALEEFLGET
jgi:hypothetical protein